MNPRAYLVFICSLVGAVPLVGGCSDDTSGTGASGGSGGSGAGQVGGAGGGENGGSNGQFTESPVESIRIEPADAVIVVDNGVIPAATDFTIIGLKADGTEEPISGTWQFTRPDVATTNNAGDVTATGLLGGKGTLTASYDGMSATADVTVQLVFVDDPLSLDPAIKDLFDTATVDDGSLNILYPYDRTVFPRGLTGPIVQWNGGADGDIYRLHVESDTFEFTSYANVPNPSRYTFPSIPADIFKLLVGSTDGQVKMDLQRYDGTTAYKAKSQTWTVAPANLAGTIYYWEINQGNVVRLKVGAAAPENFIQKPPGVQCVACHSVSANGSTLVAGFHGGYSPWGTFNTQDGASMYATDSASGFEAISPDGQFIIYGQSNNTNTMTLSPSTMLSTLAVLTPPVGAPAHPAWSTNGSKIAYGVRTDGNWLDFNNAGLYVADIDAAAPSISNQIEIVPNADPTLRVNTYPTFSPDSNWIAFQRSNTARTRAALGEVWLTSDDGTAVLPMPELNGTNYLPAPQNQASYQPTFLPVAVGGYFWVVFESERTYGNFLTDTNPASRRKQLWVAAINANPMPGEDPSHPAIWLPGQELGNQNMRGAWSLDPCKPLGSDCSAGFECCDGFCTYDEEQMKFVCGEQEGCSPDGSACEDASDCCTQPADCINGFCSSDIPQ